MSDRYPRDFGQQEVQRHSRALESLFYAAIAFAVVVYILTI